MTVYSINKRIFEQASAAAASSKSSGSSAADQFIAALNQAESQVNASGNTNSVTATPSVDQAFKQVFDRPNDTAQSAAKSDDKPKRNESKRAERDDQPTATRDSQKADDGQDRSTAATDTKTVREDSDDTKPQTKAKDEKPVDDDQPAVAAQDDTATGDVIATVVPVQQQGLDATPAAAVETAPQVVQAVAPEKAAEPTKATQTAENAPQNTAGTDAAADAAATEIVDPTATTQAAPKAQHAVKTDAAQAQANDLAAQLDDTGAQLNVQVSIDTNRPAQPTAGTAEVLLTQDVDGVQVQQPTATNGQNGGQPQTNAGTAQQTAAGAAQPGAQQVEQPVDAKPFAAILAAAQSEAASQPQAAAGSSGSQTTQTVAGLNGATGTQAAAKTAQAQTAQAARPQQMPQAKEVMDQVKVQIAKHGANGDTIKVQLKPIELGSIEVKLDVAKDGSVSGVVTADNKDTLAMLKNDSRTLEKALSEAGFKTDPGSLSFNLRGESQQQTAQDQGTSRRSRRALAGMNGIDATQSGAAAQAQARFAGGRSGVDIQV